jgi:hypothetical protein
MNLINKCIKKNNKNNKIDKTTEIQLYKNTK